MIDDAEATQRKLQRRLAWLAQQDEKSLGGPVWLGALVAAYCGMDVDEEEEAELGQLIDKIEKRLGIEGEPFFDHVTDGWQRR